MNLIRRLTGKIFASYARHHGKVIVNAREKRELTDRRGRPSRAAANPLKGKFQPQWGIQDSGGQEIKRDHGECSATYRKISWSEAPNRR
jgi:hypothetical protein